jgi:hypothetical protein
MRMLAYATLAVLAGFGPGWAEEIHRWTDSSGRVHYSNTPSGRSADDTPSPSGQAYEPSGGSQAHEPGGDAEAIPGTRAYDPEAPAASAAAPSAADTEGAFSTQASLRRSTLARDLRDTEKRIKSIDARLSDLQRVRAKNAQGSAATGGVRASLDVRSEEEERLAEEREELTKHATDVRNDYTKLRQEVTSRLGTTPPWWIDAP